MLNLRFGNKSPALHLSFVLIALLLIGSACKLLNPATFPETTESTSSPGVDQPTLESTASPTKFTPTTANETKSTHRQWAVSATDQYSSTETLNVLGEPDSEGCELTPRESVWVYQSDSPPNSANFLQVFYAEPILPTQVNIHLAYTHAAIVLVSVIDLQGQPHKIYESAPKNLEDCPHTLTIDTDELSLPVYAIRVDVEATKSDISGLTAIDAVELVGESLPEKQATPLPTPYLTMSSLGLNAADVQEGYAYFEVIENHTDETITSSECNAFSYNLSGSERTIRFFSCNGQTEIWLHIPFSLEIGSLPLNSYPIFPTARLFIDEHYIPAMDGELWIDQFSDTHMTGVLEFKGFDPENQADYYRVIAIFNQIPMNDEAAQKPGDMIIQWSKGVSASSEISPIENAASQASGPSDTWENCDNALTTWKPAENDVQPWIELNFLTPVDPEVLNILFSGNPEAISSVNLFTETVSFPLDLSEARILEGCPKALTFNPITISPGHITGVRIALDPDNINVSFGIDAVQLIGIIGE